MGFSEPADACTPHGSRLRANATLGLYHDHLSEGDRDVRQYWHRREGGRWSARHPWTAITPWIAFVAVAVVIGSAVGTKQLTESESASGESGVAARTLEKAGFEMQPGEQVIVQSKTLKATDPAFRAVVADVVTRLESTPNVVKLRSPYAQDTISKDGHSALVSFEIPGTFSTVADKVEPIQAATRAAQSAHPGFLIAEAGDGSFSKAYSDTQGEDFKKADSSRCRSRS